MNIVESYALTCGENCRRSNGGVRQSAKVRGAGEYVGGHGEGSGRWWVERKRLRGVEINGS